MSALYSMTYSGLTGLGGGAVYVGRGVVLGGDVGGGRYHGTYTQQNGTLNVEVTLTFPAGGQLVTGQDMPAGSRLEMTATWPENFADGKPQPIMVAGRPVQVTFEKIGDVP